MVKIKIEMATQFQTLTEAFEKIEFFIFLQSHIKCQARRTRHLQKQSPLH